MNKKYKIIFLVVFILAIIVIATAYLHGQNIQVLNPKGPIALKERNLLYLVLALSLFVVVPVFTAAIVFAVRYREGNTKKARYSPNWDHSRKVETLWWAFPTLLIAVLSVITWQSTQALTPSKPLVSKNPTLTIQVVALDWKWLFIYPSQGIATVNYAVIPVNTPVDFQITADAPMNSFWVPQLGGQIYAMAGMNTNLNLMASQNGVYGGSSANISGVGFAGMTFNIDADSQSAFANWEHTSKGVTNSLSDSTYVKLAEPSQNNKNTTYGSVAAGLYESIIMKYMMPSTTPSTNTTQAQAASTTDMSGMSM